MKLMDSGVENHIKKSIIATGDTHDAGMPVEGS